LELLKRYWVVGLAVAVTLTAPSSLPTTPRRKLFHATLALEAVAAGPKAGVGFGRSRGDQEEERDAGKRLLHAGPLEYAVRQPVS
jgi:hypothetical protein